MSVKISSSTSLEIRKRRPGALRQHSIQNSFLDSPPEGEKEGEYVRQKSLRKSYHLRRKGISRYYPNKKVRRSVDEADAFSWLAKPVRPSFYNRTESELLFDSEHLGPKQVQLDTQLSELEAIAIITVLEHIELMIGILKPGDPDDLDDLNILYYTTPTERFYMKPFDLPLLAGRDVLKDDADHRECMKILKIVNMAINELAWFGSYSVFRTAVLIPHIIKADEKQLIVDMQENLVHIGNLRNQIRGYSRERKVKKSQITTEREKVQGFFKKQKFFQKRDIRYLELWNKSREDQHTYSLNRIESTLKKKRDELEKKIKLTIYANNNAMLFLRMSIRDLREKSRYFERRRTSDGESLENSITEMRADLDDLQYTTLKARLLLGTIKGKYENLKARKQKIIAEERLIRAQEVAIVKLQRWWRRQLYLKSLKKPKKKGKKGKKGKK